VEETLRYAHKYSKDGDRTQSVSQKGLGLLFSATAITSAFKECYVKFQAKLKRKKKKVSQFSTTGEPRN